MRKLKEYLFKDSTKKIVYDEMLSNTIFNIDSNKIDDKRRYLYRSNDEILVFPEYYSNICPHRFKDGIEELRNYTLLDKNSACNQDIHFDLEDDRSRVYIEDYFGKNEEDYYKGSDFSFYDTNMYISNVYLISLGKINKYDVIGLFRSIVATDRCENNKGSIENLENPLFGNVLFYEAYFIKDGKILTYNKTKDKFFMTPRKDVEGLDEYYRGSSELTIKDDAFNIMSKYLKKDINTASTYSILSNPLIFFKNEFLKNILDFNIDPLSNKDFDFIKTTLNKNSNINFFRYNTDLEEMHVYTFSKDIEELELICKTVVSAKNFSAKHIKNDKVNKGFPKLGPIFISLDPEEVLRNKFEKLGFNKYNIHDLYMEMLELDYNSMNIWKDSFAYYISKYPKLELLMKDKNKGIIIEIFERSLNIREYLDLDRKKPNQIYRLNNNKINILNSFSEDYGYENYNLDMLIVLNICDKNFGSDYDYDIYEKVYLLTSGGTKKTSIKYMEEILNISFRRLAALPISKNTFFRYYYDNVSSGDVKESMFYMIYKDYISFALDLDLDLTTSLLTPKYLMREHDVLSDLLSKQADKIEKENFVKHMKMVSHLEEAPEDSKFTIVLPKEPIDLINEGNSLNHCVGGYINRVSRYSSIILFVRDKNKKDRPLYTLEYKCLDGSQELVRGDFRGSYNSLPSHEALSFVKRFEEHHNIR